MTTLTDTELMADLIHINGKLTTAWENYNASVNLQDNRRIHFWHNKVLHLTRALENREDEFLSRAEDIIIK